MSEKCPYCENENLGQVYYDQTCPGCVRRMEYDIREGNRAVKRDLSYSRVGNNRLWKNIFK